MRDRQKAVTKETNGNPRNGDIYGLLPSGVKKKNHSGSRRTTRTKERTEREAPSAKNERKVRAEQPKT